MATFDASASDDALDLLNPNMVAVGSYISLSTTQIEYLAADGTTRIILTGTFTVSGSAPTGGTVSTIEFDVSNDNDIDATISYAPADAADVLDLIASAGSFWAEALGRTGDTIIPTTMGAAVNSTYLGDFLNVGSGFTVTGKTDTFTYSGGGFPSLIFYGEAQDNDGHLTAAGDVVSYVATQAVGTLFLDVENHNSGATLIGGDDTVTTTAPSTINIFGSSYTVYGDARISMGDLTGGDDNIDVQYSANATLYGDADTTSGGAFIGGADTILGAQFGNDTVDPQPNTIYGDVRLISGGTFVGGNDTITGRNKGDIIYGDYELFSGGTIISEGDDVIDGGSGEDVIFGNGGNDTIEGGFGADTMDGGAGIDTLSYDSAIAPIGGTEGVSVNLATGAVSDIGAPSILTATGDVFSNFENVRGSAHDDILTGRTGGSTQFSTLEGLAGNDQLFGGDADDTLIGGNGNDILDGGAGDDTMSGGIGDDTFFVDNSGETVTELAGEGSDIVRTTVNYIVPDNVEVMYLIGTGNINGIGSSANDTIIGNAGNNVINGQAGADNMFGGAGNDTYVLDNVGDLVGELAGEGTDTVETSVSYTLGANIENATLTGTANNGLQGNALSNSLTGNSGNNGIAGGDGADIIQAGAGDDVLDGEAGADTMIGGSGVDTYFVDNAGDTVTEDFDSGGFDTIWTTVSRTLPDNVEILILNGGPLDIDGTGNDGPTDDVVNLMLGNNGVNTLTTFAGNDVILGLDGNDTLISGAGADLLAGGLGADILTGGAGNDLFVFTDINEAADLITDFSTADVDLLDLRVMFGGVAGANSAAAIAGGFLSVVQSGMDTLVSADMDGGGNDFVFLAQLQNTTATDVNDFILV